MTRAVAATDHPARVGPSWVDVSADALRHNLRTLRALSPNTLLAPVVKANAYGHGLAVCGPVFADAGADWLCVNDAGEAAALRALGLTLPLYILGPSLPSAASLIAATGARTVLSTPELLRALDGVGRAQGAVVPVHVKVETGTHRQGVPPEHLGAFLDAVRACPGVRLEGVTTHLSDVEDETEQSFSAAQLARFLDATRHLPREVLRHVAASAAHLIVEGAQLDLVRPGIACYGLWPSESTRISSQLLHGDALTLRPALSWRARAVQLQDAPRGAYVGYGRTARLSRPSRLALLPVGYFDGYDRGLSGRGVVLHEPSGRTAPVLGRVAMNMVIVDATDLPVALGDVFVLVGPESVDTSADRVAAALGTINYEITTRIEGRIPRVLVEFPAETPGGPEKDAADPMEQT